MRTTTRTLSAVVTAAAIGSAFMAGTGVASAATTFQLNGWVTTSTFGEFPLPSAHYTGTVTSPGHIRVAIDCLRSAANPSGGCVGGDGTASTIGRVMNWQNLTTHQHGSVTNINNNGDMPFIADVGQGRVNVQVYKPINGIGLAVGSVNS